MAKILDPNQPVPFVPADQQALPEGQRLTYWLRPPRSADRITLARAVAAAGGRKHAAPLLLRRLRQVVEERLADAPDERAALLQPIQAMEEAQATLQAGLMGGAYAGDGGLDLLQADHTRIEACDRDLIGLSRIIQDSDPLYAGMVADNRVYDLVVGTESARLLLVDWSRPTPIRRTLAGVSDDVLALIPEHHLCWLGQHVAGLMTQTEEERKNSGSPSPSPSADATSTAASLPPQNVH